VTRVILLASILLPFWVQGQEVAIREPGPGPAAEIVRRVMAGPHVVRAGEGPLVLPRDSTVTTGLLVLGRPTYLASRVQGDVVVIGADLFLRPGADVSGRAVAIGGTVAETTQGRVAGGVESRRDETFAVRRDSGGTGYALDYLAAREEYREPMFQLTGVGGIQNPAYDRVDGLALGVGGMLQVQEHVVEIEPTVTYRSRLGAFDPALMVRLNPLGKLRFEGSAARVTRTNDDWIYGNLLNSVLVLVAGADTRNYFRSDIAEGRITQSFERSSYIIEPYIGARYENVTPIMAVGNVWSAWGRKSLEKILRPNPPVEPGHIGSALLGVDYLSSSEIVLSRLDVAVEPAFRVPSGTARFVQLTVDGAISFPTFGTQRLNVRAHAVATQGDSVPRARYAYLGGTGTLQTLDILEQGGSALLYVENRYTIPLEMARISLGPAGIIPVLTLRDAFGAAGVGSLPGLQHEIGVGIGLSAIRLDVTRGVAGRKRTELGVGISLSR
jgi:hypothetical protein